MSEETTLAERIGRIEDVDVVNPAPMIIVPPTPEQEIAAASRVATELDKIIKDKKLYVPIGKKDHVFVEGWTTLAALRGCTPREVSSVRDPERKGVYTATVELVNAQGRVIGSASAECGDPDEPLWANRTSQARKSMANTRATSKVCRQVFSWIMVLAGYAATPAEEMPKEEGKKTTKTTAKPQNATEKPSQTQEDGSGYAWDGELVMKTGKYKGDKWREIPLDWLNWVVENKKGPVDLAVKELSRRSLESVEPTEKDAAWHAAHSGDGGGETVEGEIVDDSELEGRFQ